MLSALAASLYVGASGVARSPEAILPLLALTILLAAVFQIFFSAIGGGRLIKFVPYPVVSGYLSGVGVLIALGQIPKLLGLPHGTPLSHGLLSPDLWQWQGIAVGVSTMTVMGAAPYITKKIPGAILGLASGMIAYFAIAFFSPACSRSGQSIRHRVHRAAGLPAPRDLAPVTSFSPSTWPISASSSSPR